MTIKEWFLKKNFTAGEVYAIQTSRDAEVVKETEKAYFLKFDTAYGKITGWFPKSVCITDVSEQKTVNVGSFSVGMIVETKTGEHEIITAINGLAITLSNGKQYVAATLKPF